jgi:hypothetical protein
MKKLIVTLVAIFALQGAFIDYTAINPFPELAALSAPGLEVADDDMLFGSELRAAVGGYEPVSVRKVEPARTAPARAERPQLATIAGAVPRETRPRRDRSPATDGKVIFRNEMASVVVSPRYEPHETSSSDSPRTEKRSFITNVVKKPYDLFKAIGSRLR